MRPIKGILAIAGLAVATLAANAQDVSTTTEATSTTTAGVTGPANTSISDRYMASVQAELTGKIDSKNAAVGQQVTARTTQTATLANGTTLPKGTRLLGHVAQVQAANGNQGLSALAIAFDRAELKGGQSIALRSVIRTVAPPANMAASANDSMMGDQQMGPMGGGVSAGGGSRGGLGGGGIAGGTVRGAGQTVGGVGQTAGGAVRTAGTTVADTNADAHTLTQAAASPGGGIVTQAGESVSAAPRATALPGVMLATSGSANASGTLVASGRNISLENGTQITLGLITQ